jgi:hypothetical protein
MLRFVGVAGWCEVIEEHGITGGSACGGVPTPASPFLQILGFGEANARKETQVAVTDPQVGEILAGGHRRVPTQALRGLPYGLRGARVITVVGAKIEALDAAGSVIPERWGQTPRQALHIRRWRSPHRQPSGPCQLRADGLPGLVVRGGTTATTIRPFPGQLVGRAFLPCSAVEYELRRVPLRAVVVLDAAQPSARAAALPNFHALRGAPGIFAGGDLTAMRSGNAWLIVEQGRGPAQRTLLLRHLQAALHLAS